MTPAEAQAEVDRLDEEARALDRPSIAFRDLLRREAVVAFGEVIAGWERRYPEKAARWSQLLAQMGAAKTQLERHNLIAAESEAVLSRLLELGVGARHVDALRRADVTAPLSVVQAWWPSDSWSLVLLGGPGTGKTVGAAWAAREALVAGGRVKWLRAQAVASQSFFGDVAQRFAATCRAASLLVLDDLGAEQATDIWRSWLGDVIDARYASNLRTLVSSNLAIEDLKAHLGARLVDRMAEGGRVVGVGMVSRRRVPPQPPEAA